ncbi:hypothetical protein [Pandoraea fibrosis]|uniref:Uncharacterized protein n=1 Tax=Pandoraea fibrosis TaxID=1891094 RepID=A0A5E4Z3D9_9BURK|nr:hypothetical protein [Pandoraea fibrosis]VVE55599.1 hypothetical protein PFI31113_04992 [Pandoraea fibrosis]
MLKVGFYDAVKGQMVQVEEFKSGIDFARMASLELTKLWQSGRHSLPSMYWVAWDNGKSICSIFVLDGVSFPEEGMCDRIEKLVAAL